MHRAVLAVHITSGTLGLLLGPVALTRPGGNGWAGRLGLAYRASVAVLCASAVALAVWAPSLWWLGLVAVATAGAALGAERVRRQRSPGWQARHLRLLGGSYIALVSALVVVSVPVPVFWVLPTLVGTPLVEWAAGRSRSPTATTLLRT
jgi:hypothetical protein